MDRIGDRAAVTISPQIGNLVAERARVVETTLGPPESSGARPPGTPAVILDTTAGEAGGDPLWTRQDRARVTDDLTDAGYQIAYRQEGIILFTR